MDQDWTASFLIRFRSLLLKMSSERFVSLTEDELREITDGKDAKNRKLTKHFRPELFDDSGRGLQKIHSLQN
jgi:hypothetical protein